MFKRRALLYRYRLAEGQLKEKNLIFEGEKKSNFCYPMLPTSSLKRIVNFV